MSDITDHRDAFFTMVEEAHGTPLKRGLASPDAVLPPGARWVPHQPNLNIKPRKNGPASGFFRELFQS